MINSLPNIINQTPDYLLGVEKNQLVLTPLDGPLTGASGNDARSAMVQYVTTWAAKPAASAVAAGSIIAVTDVGVGGRSYWWSDGTIWRPMNGAVDVSGSANPVILPSSGSSNATGVITMTTALPYTLATGQLCSIYLPSGVVTAGSQGTGAAVYQATGLNTNNTVQISGTGIVTANTSYTQTTGSDLALVSVTIPAGSLGTTGGVRLAANFLIKNSANNKIPSVTFGATTIATATLTTTANRSYSRTLRNRGSAAIQVTDLGPEINTTATTGTASTIDTASDVTLAFKGQLANAADNIVLDFYTVEILG